VAQFVLLRGGKRLAIVNSSSKESPRRVARDLEISKPKKSGKLNSFLQVLPIISSGKSTLATKYHSILSSTITSRASHVLMGV
jgi:hypothetical protein